MTDMPEPGDPYASAFVSEVGQCWRMIHDRQMQAAHCPEAGYGAAGDRILGSLMDSFSTARQPDSNALILHGVYDKPKNVGVDEGNLWGDYFYLEALTRVARPDWTNHW